MTLTEIATTHFDWLVKMGWTKTGPLEDLALITSEIGEAVNECRGERPAENLGVELADIVLRTLGVAMKNNIDIESEVVKKIAINRERGTRGRIK